MIEATRQIRHERSRRSAVVIVLFLLVTLRAYACPEETVDYGTFKLRQLSGKLIADGDDFLLLGEHIHFIIRKQGDDDSAKRRVAVAPNGEFLVALPPGTYDFTIKVDGYLFTAIGVVVIDPDASATESMTFRLPWC